MGRVLTNNTSFAYALEGTETEGSRAIGFLPGEDPGDGGGVLAGTSSWKQIEPNDITSFGSQISTVSRNPIRRSRGRQKGTISDLDSAVEFEADITTDAFDDFIEGFMFSSYSNTDLIFRAADASTVADDYTVPSLNAGQAAKLQSDANIDTLLYASGYLNAANNGLKTLATAAAATDTTLTVAENLITETAPTNARLEIAGATFLTSEISGFVVTAQVPDVSPRIGVATFANVAPTSLGLSVGQLVFLELGATVKGYCIVSAFDATTLTVTNMDAALVSDTPAGVTNLFFGQYVRDVASDDANFLERSFQFEAAYPGLAADSIATEFEYPRGNFCNTINFSLDLSDKGVFSAAFIGTDTDVPTGTRKANAASALGALGTAAYSTVADFARLRIADIDEDGLTTDFKSIEMEIDNNVSPEKVLNNLGAKFINFGNFFVNLTAQVLFTDGSVLDRIRENTTVGLDLFLTNDDGVISFSIPSMTLGDGSKDLPVNETVLLNISGEAFEDAVTGSSLNVSFIPSVPA